MDKWNIFWIVISCLFIMWDGGYQMTRDEYERKLNNTDGPDCISNPYGTSTSSGDNDLAVYSVKDFDDEFTKWEASVDTDNEKLGMDIPVVNFAELIDFANANLKAIGSGVNKMDNVSLVTDVESQSCVWDNIASVIFGEKDTVQSDVNLDLIGPADDVVEINGILISTQSPPSESLVDGNQIRLDNQEIRNSIELDDSLGNAQETVSDSSRAWYNPFYMLFSSDNNQTETHVDNVNGHDDIAQTSISQSYNVGVSEELSKSTFSAIADKLWSKQDAPSVMLKPEFKFENNNHQIISHETAITRDNESHDLMSFIFIFACAYVYVDDWRYNGYSPPKVTVLKMAVNDDDLSLKPPEVKVAELGVNGDVVVVEVTQDDLFRELYGDMLVVCVWCVVALYLMYEVSHNIRASRIAQAAIEAARLVSRTTQTDFKTAADYENNITELRQELATQKELVSDLEDRNRLLDHYIVVSSYENLVYREKLQTAYQNLKAEHLEFSTAV